MHLLKRSNCGFINTYTQKWTIMAAFRGMHMSPAKHSESVATKKVWLSDRHTDRIVLQIGKKSFPCECMSPVDCKSLGIRLIHLALLYCRCWLFFTVLTGINLPWSSDIPGTEQICICCYIYNGIIFPSLSPAKRTPIIGPWTGSTWSVQFYRAKPERHHCDVIRLRQNIRK